MSNTAPECITSPHETQLRIMGMSSLIFHFVMEIVFSLKGICKRRIGLFALESVWITFLIGLLAGTSCAYVVMSTIWRLKLTWIVFKYYLLTAQSAHSLFVLKTGLLMLRWRIISLCCGNHKKSGNTVCGQNVGIDVKPGRSTEI